MWRTYSGNVHHTELLMHTELIEWPSELTSVWRLAVLRIALHTNYKPWTSSVNRSVCENSFGLWQHTHPLHTTDDKLCQCSPSYWQGVDARVCVCVWCGRHLHWRGQARSNGWNVINGMVSNRCFPCVWYRSINMNYYERSSTQHPYVMCVMRSNEITHHQWCCHHYVTVLHTDR
jgi:hypothetical protein